MLTFKKYRGKCLDKYVPGEQFSNIRNDQINESAADPEVDVHHPSAGVFSPRFNKDDRESIKAYCNDPPDRHNSSSSLSKYTRNRSRAKADEHHDAPTLHFRAQAKDVHEAAKKMQSAFRPENTNKKHLTSYSGLASKKVASAYSSLKEGERFTNQSTTSSSTHPNVAKGFSRTLLFKAHKEGETVHENDDRRHLHIAEIRHEPNTCISPTSHKKSNERAASLTKHEGEDEVISRHGTKCTYHGKTVHTADNPHPLLGPHLKAGRDKELGVKSITVHHISMHDLSAHEPTDINHYPHPYVDHHLRYSNHKTGEWQHPAYDETHGEHAVASKDQTDTRTK
jgi:hypothetical protein